MDPLHVESQGVIQRGRYRRFYCTVNTPIYGIMARVTFSIVTIQFESPNMAITTRFPAIEDKILILI